MTNESLCKDAEWGTSVNERVIYQKILNFQGNLKNSLCCPNFPCVVPKFPVFSLSGKTDNQIPCFPCAVATLIILLSLPYITISGFLCNTCNCCVRSSILVCFSDKSSSLPSFSCSNSVKKDTAWNIHNNLVKSHYMTRNSLYFQY